MNLKYLFCIGVFFIISSQTFAQRGRGDQSYLGVTGGLSIFNILTDDLVTKPGQGFAGGFVTRGGYFNDFDMVYGLNFQNSKLNVEGQETPTSKTEDIGYTIQGVQIYLFGSYNLIVNHLSVEFGPVFGINGKMKLDDEELKDYYLSKHTGLQAEDIQNISKFDFRLAGGLTAGFQHFRLNAQYQYGLTNSLGKLNKENLKTEFKGNSSTIFLGAVVYF